MSNLGKSSRGPPLNPFGGQEPKIGSLNEQTPFFSDVRSGAPMVSREGPC